MHLVYKFSETWLLHWYNPLDNILISLSSSKGNKQKQWALISLHNDQWVCGDHIELYQALTTLFLHFPGNTIC